MVYVIAFSVVWVLGHLLFRIKTVGKENLPTDRGYILCPNHISALDPVFIVIARGAGRKLAIMGKEELFKNPILAWLFRSVGVVEVQRGKGDTEAIDESINAVKNGRGMLIFPEGTRTPDGELGKFKSGAFFIAANTEADIIPCRITYSTGKMKLFCRILIVFGTPVSMQEMGLLEGYKASNVREAKQMLKNDILALPEAKK